MPNCLVLVTADSLQWEAVVAMPGGVGGGGPRAVGHELRLGWTGLLTMSGQAGYTICVAQCKMKYGPLVQRTGKKHEKRH